MGETYDDPGPHPDTTVRLALNPTSILEMGTHQWQPGVSTAVGPDWFPGALHVGTDICPGPGVDYATDAHTLAGIADGAFDLIISRSVFEHMERPWLAVAACARVLQRGGHLFVETPQAFPIHGYPSDFWRFTVDGLRILAEDAGLTVVAAGYTDPCDVVPRQPPAGTWNPAAGAWLYAQILARKA